ncbi:MAG: prolyl oligopeptidase family serine peptidase [Prevotellaceae bacterium]|nr:prolyl oligopeptidase family serine peptidase [Prevotellaceae bacterium]MDY2749164.1 prolyl oligopeptidase family serine peptidase [Prevotella sp.]
MTRHPLLSAIPLLLYSITLSAQGTAEDYNRAYSLRDKYSSRNYFYTNANPRWQQDSDTFWYVRNTPDGDVLVTVDAATQTETVERDKAVLEAKLKEERDKLPRPSTRHWMEVDDEKGSAPVPSPDGKWLAFIKNDNVFVRSTDGKEERQLSTLGTAGNYYSSYIQWSPDGKYLATCRIRPAEKRYVYYVESSPTDQLQPKLHKQEYAKPGDELRFKVPCIFSLDGTQRLIPDTRLFSNQFDLYGPSWREDSKGITFEYNERGHKVYRILEMSAADGSVRPLVEETNDKYIFYNRLFRHILKGGTQLIWSSERDNYNHLYLINTKDGSVAKQITCGQWYVRQVIKVDEDTKQIYFSASGVNKDEDPYLIHYYRIGFDGKNMTCLTPGEGHHKAWFSSSMKYLVDQYSMVNKAPVTVLRSAADGTILMTLDKADISRLEAEGWTAPEPFVAPGRDDKTPMYGIIQRPTNFDPTKKYPVIEYIYQGPGDQYVPKSFQSYNWWTTSLAELGFIVVMIDGMGTSFRSRSFENVCYKNLRDAAIPDHIAWIRAAAAKYPYMDIDRVGIYGMSAGGQESLSALLHFPDFYKCAYSACGCHDNRMDKIWWNEQWMGYPVDEHYKESSNVENAHLLKRPLMLVVGEMDDNVDPASTMQVAAALIKANKDFELVVIPGARHTMGEAYGEHKRYDFFVKHLLGVNPPQWEDVKQD